MQLRFPGRTGSPPHRPWPALSSAEPSLSPPLKRVSPAQGAEGKPPLIFPGVTLSGYKTCQKVSLKKLEGAERDLWEGAVQRSLGGKFTVWGLFSIFDLIYSGVLSLTPQGQPM